MTTEQLNFSLAVSKKDKEVLVRAAKRDDRSLANYLKQVIGRHVQELQQATAEETQDGT